MFLGTVIYIIVSTIKYFKTKNQYTISPSYTFGDTDINIMDMSWQEFEKFIAQLMKLEFPTPEYQVELITITLIIQLIQVTQLKMFIYLMNKLKGNKMSKEILNFCKVIIEKYGIISLLSFSFSIIITSTVPKEIIDKLVFDEYNIYWFLILCFCIFLVLISGIRYLYRIISTEKRTEHLEEVTWANTGKKEKIIVTHTHIYKLSDSVFHALKYSIREYGAKIISIE